MFYLLLGGRICALASSRGASRFSAFRVSLYLSFLILNHIQARWGSAVAILQ